MSISRRAAPDVTCRIWRHVVVRGTFPRALDKTIESPRRFRTGVLYPVIPCITSWLCGTVQTSAQTMPVLRHFVQRQGVLFFSASVTRRRGTEQECLYGRPGTTYGRRRRRLGERVDDRPNWVNYVQQIDEATHRASPQTRLGSPLPHVAAIAVLHRRVARPPPCVMGICG